MAQTRDASELRRAELLGRLMDLFLREGFRVARNTPYAGGHTTALYGKVGTGSHALQIEINRALYLDEDRIAKKAVFESVRARLGRAMQFLTAIPLSHLRRPSQEAAE